MPVEIPQPPGPGDAIAVAHHGPVIILDLVVQFRAEARYGDRARIPADRGIGFPLFDHGTVGRLQLFAPRLERRSAIRAGQAPDLFDQ